MSTGFMVTKTQRAPGALWSDLPVHETFAVRELAEAGEGIAWMSTGHGTFSGTKNYGRIDLASYIARPIN